MEELGNEKNSCTSERHRNRVVLPVKGRTRLRIKIIDTESLWIERDIVLGFRDEREPYIVKCPAKGHNHKS